MSNIIIKSLTTNKRYTESSGGYKGNYLVGKFKGQVRFNANNEIEITISNMKLGKEMQKLLLSNN